ncbi:MAG: hypothetical protein LEGION0398_MBIBDBAK_01163 [Legionellaceae bacterium]
MPHHLKGYNNKNVNIMKFIKDSDGKGINFQENKKLHPERFALSYINYEYHEHDDSRLGHLECKEGCNSERLRATILRHCIFVHFQLKGNRLKNAKSDKEIQNGIIDNIHPNFIDADINTSQSFSEETGILGKSFGLGIKPLENLTQALQLYYKKKYSDARPLFRKLAKQGNPIAQFMMGFMSLYAYGILPSDKRAFEWFKKAADQGYAQGLANLGFMYGNGRGVEKDEKQAFFWFQKAADKGDSLGQNNLGFMYGNGRGVEKDEKQAFFWFQKAADKGDSLGQNNLGFMYANGRGVEKDEKQAVFWFQKVADQGYAEAQLILGTMYEYGRGV